MKRAYIIPFYPGQNNDKFFDDMEPYDFAYKLKEDLISKGYEVSTMDNKDPREAEVIFVFGLSTYLLLKLTMLNCVHKCVYIAFEPPAVFRENSPSMLIKLSKCFRAVFTWQDDIVDNISIFKFYYPYPTIDYEKVDVVDFSKKYFLNTIIGNKTSDHPDELYSERRSAIEYFTNLESTDFSLYGRGWDNEGIRSYKGEVDNKISLLSKFKFSICFENQKDINGLVSEKILDCFVARCIPIFFGPRNVEEYFPKNCYIDFRDFDTYEKINSYLNEMNEDSYNQRIKSINDFMKGDDFKKYSSDFFAKTIIDKALKRKTEKQFYWLSLEYIARYIFIKIVSKIKRRV